jgi:hypothetical protein
MLVFLLPAAARADRLVTPADRLEAGALELEVGATARAYDFSERDGALLRLQTGYWWRDGAYVRAERLVVDEGRLASDNALETGVIAGGAGWAAGARVRLESSRTAPEPLDHGPEVGAQAPLALKLGAHELYLAPSYRHGWSDSDRAWGGNILGLDAAWTFERTNSSLGVMFENQWQMRTGAREPAVFRSLYLFLVAELAPGHSLVGRAGLSWQEQAADYYVSAWIGAGYAGVFHLGGGTNAYRGRTPRRRVELEAAVMDESVSAVAPEDPLADCGALRWIVDSPAQRTLRGCGHAVTYRRVCAEDGRCVWSR